jgi:hypothetical protein
MKQTVCDHCGKDDKKSKISVVEIVIGGYETEADLCGVCHGELITKVERFISGGEQGDR